MQERPINSRTWDKFVELSDDTKAEISLGNDWLEVNRWNQLLFPDFKQSELPRRGLMT